MTEAGGASHMMLLSETLSAGAPDDLHPVIEHVIELYDSLETRYERLRHAYAGLMERHMELDEQLRTMRDLHFIATLEGKIVQANQAAYVIAPMHSLVGSQLVDWIETSYQGKFRGLQTFAAQGGLPVGEESELRLRCDEAGLYGLLVAAKVLLVDEGNGSKSLHWVMRDVHPQAGVMLAPPRPLVEFDRVSECVMMTDESGDILAVNAAFTRTTGYSADEVIGRNPRLLQSGLQDSDFYRDLWRDVQAAGMWQGQIFNRRKNGEIYSQWMKILAAKDREGKVQSYTAVFYDQTVATTSAVQRMTQTLPHNVYRTEPPTSGLGEMR